MADIQELTKKAVKLLNNSKETELILNKEAQFLLLKQAFPSDLNATFYESALWRHSGATASKTPGA